MQNVCMAVMSIMLLQVAWGQETFCALQDGKVPRTVEDLWAGYDPRKEPLEIEVLKAWEEEGVVLKVVRYRMGIFKGQKAMMAAVYGYPKGGTKLPGLLQIHGGGQYADYKAPLANAKRGYATLSIAWAGRIMAPGYVVNPDVVALFWANKTNDPKYAITTDWGALDGYHAPCRNEKNHFAAVAPQPWTLDEVDSPRNNPWFLCTLGARRGLTFLEQQPEVDKEKLGVYGHSMGGKLTVLTAGSDVRVKAAAPSCGGISDRPTDNALYGSALADAAYLRRITCPIIFLSPANDFHGRINDLEKALSEITSSAWRVTCSPHHNHQDTEPYQVAGLLWFDQHLKGCFVWPATPEVSLTLRTSAGIPTFVVNPDTSRKILTVDIFYTQQGKEEVRDDRENTIARFWHHAKVKQRNGAWVAELSVLDTERPVWAYANVRHQLDQPVTGAGYYYGIYTATNFNLSSRMMIATSTQLKHAGVRATDKPSRVIENFESDWMKAWFTYDLSGRWPRKTHKLYDPKWYAPAGAKLVLNVCSEQANTLVVGLDNYAVEVSLNGGPASQNIVLAPSDFCDVWGTPLSSWNGVKEFRLSDKEMLGSKEGKTRMLGNLWKGADPTFSLLKWSNVE